MRNARSSPPRVCETLTKESGSAVESHENPPPPLREVRTRLGAAQKTIYRNFPEIYRVIAARYQNFPRQWRTTLA
jgi:hypothetical protein